MAGYPVQRRRPPSIMRAAARRRMPDSGTLSGPSGKEERRRGEIPQLREGETSTVQAVADVLLSLCRLVDGGFRQGSPRPLAGSPGHFRAAASALVCRAAFSAVDKQRGARRSHEDVHVVFDRPTAVWACCIGVRLVRFTSRAMSLEFRTPVTRPGACR
jgi:hypothetical protein